jgi:DNA repair protein RadD
MLDLRPYQVDIRQALREFFRQGRRRVILQAETGSGKTVLAADMLRAVWEKDNPALFIAHRRELVLQCSLRLTEHGVPHGLIMSRKPMSHEPIQVASKDTLLEWGVRGSEIELPPARLVIIDECHLSAGFCTTTGMPSGLA